MATSRDRRARSTWCFVCASGSKPGSEELITNLLTKVGFFNPGISGELFRWTLHNDPAGLQDIRAVGMLQGGMSILFYEQDGRSFTLNFINRFEDSVNDERRQPQR